jgi:hypothetical protein
MKFPKPRELKNNEYPDLQEDEPTFVKNVQMTVTKNQTADNLITGHPLNAQYATADTTSETSVN